ncbi:MAG: ribonuclease R [Bacteroidales bacterium]|jgi:ribonuclease R|nr:ribonuclease R [Bacteroidales bacterium]
MTRRKGKIKKSPAGKQELLVRVMTIFQRHPNELLNYRQITKRMEINDEATRRLLPSLLHELEKDKQIKETERGKYKLNLETGCITGKVDMTAHGYAYIISPESEEDVFVSQKHLREALHGDTVKVHLFARRKSAKLEGQVVKVIERSRSTFVGTIGISENFAFMIPDSRFMPYDLFIPQGKEHGAKDGQKVVARIIDWPHRAKNPIGEVVEVLGDPGQNETEMHAILAEFELPYRFEKKVEDTAASISAEISEEEIKNRRDFRGIPTLTIDPADAKDFDDALSLRKLDNGNWEVGIHIADVTHYIQPGSLLDKEAINRATSIYLVDRVVPMLPEKLSNNLCSLRPDEDKLCFSSVFEMDDHAHVLKQWFGRTIIRSINRLSYEEAQVIIDTGAGKMKEEIMTLHHLAQTLREDRFKKGSISFERAEPKFNLDKNGKPLGVYFVENTTSHQLIEEFMLLANRRVAEYCSDIMQVESPPRNGKGKVGVYRIHDKPNMEKLENFAGFITRFGYSIKTSSDRSIASSLNKLLEKVKGTKEENMIETLALRSMAKADYSTDNIGHYGLGFKYYTHFTSPIRRYPDMMVHRLLQYYLDGNGTKPDKNELEALCRQSSNMEHRAVDAERASIKYKQVEFMIDKVGQCFDGIISGVTEWGIYVELNENKCEGMIHIRELNDDFYIFDEENYCIKGKQRGRTFRLGSPIRIEVWRANLLKKQLDFRLAEDNVDNKGKNR